jgi:hypothetical protein
MGFKAEKWGICENRSRALESNANIFRPKVGVRQVPQAIGASTCGGTSQFFDLTTGQAVTLWDLNFEGVLNLDIAVKSCGTNYTFHISLACS